MSMWKRDRRKKNTLSDEIERLGRVTVALRTAYEENRRKHVLSDLNELDMIYHELKRLTEEEIDENGN